MLPDDGRRPKHVGAIVYVYFSVNFNLSFKLIKVLLLVSELYIYQNSRCSNKNSVVISAGPATGDLQSTLRKKELTD